MARELPKNDFRRVRRCLIEDAYQLPQCAIDREIWDNLVNLNDTVLIETIDGNANAVQLAHRIGWSWLNIYDRCLANSPISKQVFAVLECFEGSRFNAFTGWYRTAGIMLRCGLEDMLLGLFFQGRNDERRVFDQIVSGTAISPRIGDILRGIADVSEGAARLSDEVRQLYHNELSVYVHRVSHGTIWESTGPIYVPAAFNTWFDQYLRTYRLMCELIDAVAPGTDATVVARELCDG